MLAENSAGKNWGLSIDEPFDFPVGKLYAEDLDQAGNAYWFYEGVLSYGMYVWALLDGVCSGIHIEKGKYIDDRNPNFFVLEESHDEIHSEISAYAKLFAPVLNLSMDDFETEDDLMKDVSRLLEGFASFSSQNPNNNDYIFSLDPGFFPEHIADGCKIVFNFYKGCIDMALVIRD